MIQIRQEGFAALPHAALCLSGRSAAVNGEPGLQEAAFQGEKVARFCSVPGQTCRLQAGV